MFIYVSYNDVKYVVNDNKSVSRYYDFIEVL